MDGDEEDGEVSDAGAATTDDADETGANADGDEDLELSDLDPNAEEAARQVERQLRRIRRETSRN